MRILWLKAGLLLPLDKGGNLRTWHLMRHLAERHQITFLSFADPDTDPAHIAGMREVATAVHVVPRHEPAKGSLAFYAKVARHLIDPLPYAVGAYRSPAFKAKAAELCRDEAFDVIVCDFLPPALSLPNPAPCPVVLFTHNVEADIWRRHAETATAPLRRWLYTQQFRRMQRFEQRTLSLVDGVLGVSDADARRFEQLYPGALSAPMQVIPTGVDTAYFANDAPAADSRTVVFTGSMDWLPNDDAMQFFVRDILPIVRADESDAALSIVGRAPTPAVRALAKTSGVTVTGRVDDVRPYMSAASVYAVPLRIGGGTRLKIFEAMAMGLPVVSTSVGAEGLPVTPGVHFLLADDARSFADAIVTLFRDPALRRRLGEAGRALVKTHYDWSAVAGTLEDALSGVRVRAAHAAASTRRRRRATTTLAPMGER